MSKDVCRRVIVIDSNQDYATDTKLFPPVGTKGTVIKEMDEEGDYEILFDDHPLMPTDPGWFTHKNMIRFIDDDEDVVLT